MIKKLDDTVIQRIAAGEVIQNVTNAVKELLENSLDAGASQITISVHSNNLTIRDNGSGIDWGDLPLLCARYATSKLRSTEDLSRVDTFGFRGEALASISHICRLSVLTKSSSNDDMMGWSCSYVDGLLTSEPKSVVVAEKGSTFILNDIFYNNPLRRKSVDMKGILALIQKYSLAYCGRCAFTLFNGKNLLLKTECKQSKELLVASFYTKNTLLSMNKDKMEGLITGPYDSLSQLVFILFVNGRLVESVRLKRFLLSLYGEVLPKGRFPFVFLHLSIEKEKVDVNVHPSKEIVVILDEDLLFEEILECLRNTLKSVGRELAHVPTINVSITDKPALVSRPSEQIRADYKSRPLEYYSLKRNPPSPETDFSSPKLPRSSSSENPFAIRESPVEIATVSKALLEARAELNSSSDQMLGDMLRRHVWVGQLSPRNCLLQVDSKLVLIDVPSLYSDYLKRVLLFNWERRCVEREIEPVLRAFLEKEGLDKKDLTEEIISFLNDKNEILLLLNIQITRDKIQMPLVPDNLGKMLFVLAVDIEWDLALPTLLISLASLVASFTTMPSSMRYDVFDRMRTLPEGALGYSRHLANNGCITQLTTVAHLYRIFERC